jgi:hypothetical protein
MNKILRVEPGVYQMIMKAHNWYCIVEGCYNKADDLMHGIPKEKWAIRRWPLFIHSPFNLYPGCRDHHNKIGSWKFKITDKVADMFEAFLQGIVLNPEKYLQMMKKVQR